MQNSNRTVSTSKKYARDRSKIALVGESFSDRREIFTFFELERSPQRGFTLMNCTPEIYAAIPAVVSSGAPTGEPFETKVVSRTENVLAQRFSIITGRPEAARKPSPTARTCRLLRRAKSNLSKDRRKPNPAKFSARFCAKK